MGSGGECPGLLVLSKKSRSLLVGPRRSDDDCADLHRDKRRLLSTESPLSHSYILYPSWLDAFTFLSHHMLRLAHDKFWNSNTTVEVKSTEVLFSFTWKGFGKDLPTSNVMSELTQVVSTWLETKDGYR